MIRTVHVSGRTVQVPDGDSVLVLPGGQPVAVAPGSIVDVREDGVWINGRCAALSAPGELGAMTGAEAADRGCWAEFETATAAGHACSAYRAAKRGDGELAGIYRGLMRESLTRALAAGPESPASAAVTPSQRAS